MTIIFDNVTKLTTTNKNYKQYVMKLLYTHGYPNPYKYTLFIIGHYSAVTRISKLSHFSI